MKREPSPTLTIACQGGGSHTVFNAGVLDRLPAEEPHDFEVVGLKGSFEGAVRAFATWFGLPSDGGGRETGRRLLSEVWDDLAARGALDARLNAVGVGVSRAGGTLGGEARQRVAGEHGLQMSDGDTTRRSGEPSR